ncbi:hypothetical protein GCM10017782_23340 [Deinococcus ficus]|nr:hypothetical protein GCM10017782_23340 [Deinococcus ficus]
MRGVTSLTSLGPAVAGGSSGLDWDSGGFVTGAAWAFTSVGLTGRPGKGWNDREAGTFRIAPEGRGRHPATGASGQWARQVPQPSGLYSIYLNCFKIVEEEKS